MDIDLTLILAAAVSLLFAYIPGFETWYTPLEPTVKRLVMAGILLVITAGIFGYNCAQLAGDFACDVNSAIELLKLYVAAIMANQGTYSLFGTIGKTQRAEVSAVVDEKRETVVVEAGVKEDGNG